NQGDETVIADRYDVALSDNAVCHRNFDLGDSQCVFISTRLMDDKFSVAFEFYINVGHAVVERAGVSQAFADLAWKQVAAGVRGETSLDAWDARKLATGSSPDAEKYKNEYFAASFADAISIYLLSLFLDVDYHDLRERDYPLLAPTPMAERLRKVAELCPPNPVSGPAVADHFGFSVFDGSVDVRPIPCSVLRSSTNPRPDHTKDPSDGKYRAEFQDVSPKRPEQVHACHAQRNAFNKRQSKI